MTFGMLLKVLLAISICLFISPSHFPLSIIKCQRYISFLTCSIALPAIVSLALGVTFLLITNTLVFFILMLIQYSFPFFIYCIYQVLQFARINCSSIHKRRAVIQEISFPSWSHFLCQKLLYSPFETIRL